MNELDVPQRMRLLSNVRRAFEDVFYARRMPVPNGLGSSALTTNDEDLYWAAHAEACDALDRAKGSYGSKVKYLPPHWRRIYTITALDADVINGGFHQFFTNAGGRYDQHLIEDVEAFGQDVLAEIVRRAWKQYAALDYSDQWKNRGKSWDYFVEPYKEGRFDAEDKDYYDLMDKDWLTPYIGRHVRENFDLFASASSTDTK